MGDQARRRWAIVLVVAMLVMPSVGLARRALGSTEVEHPFSWQMYTVTEEP